jgi:NhaP-type Na+/H+ or K+/H+ antiporter
LAAVFVWGTFSAKAAAISTPIFFVAIGIVMAQGLKLFQLEPDPHLIKMVAELTLVWVLFADASRVRVADFRADRGLYLRLLALGLPLTIALGAVAGVVVLGVNPWYALLVGAALAPTDAALGSAVMSDRRVPRRIRQALNVEYLNDGIATRSSFCYCGIAAAAGLTEVRPCWSPPPGVVVGVALEARYATDCAAKGWAPTSSPAQRCWPRPDRVSRYGRDWRQRLLAALLEQRLRPSPAAWKRGHYVEQTCGLASMISVRLGAVIIPARLPAGPGILVCAVRSLTVVRMLPVAVSLQGPAWTDHSALRGLGSTSRASIDRLRAHPLRTCTA